MALRNPELHASNDDDDDPYLAPPQGVTPSKFRENV